jgi:hypothetical protein
MRKDQSEMLGGNCTSYTKVCGVPLCTVLYFWVESVTYDTVVGPENYVNKCTSISNL